MKPTDKYDDIIDLPHHSSPSRPHMSMWDRAAQFSPFAALTGYDDAVAETARLTDEKTELTEDAKSALNAKIQMIADVLQSRPTVNIIYFKPDARKSGGEYIQISGRVRAIDEYERTIIMEDKTVIQIDAVREIEGDLFF